VDGKWDVSWLGNDAGWLHGTAFPTWAGNSVITGHVFDANGKPGLFADLTKLKYGDQIILHAFGQAYIYEVRETKLVTPNNLSAMTQHEDLPWLTLVTCRGYDEANNTYYFRYLVRAVQVKIK
jgi:LPXTG-site transpeptidase (sortase) family protein